MRVGVSKSGARGAGCRSRLRGGIAARVERLEIRRLLASVGWSVEFSGTVDAATRASISDFVQRAGNEWAALIPQEPDRPNVQLQVLVTLQTVAGGSTGRLSAKSTDNVQVGPTTSTLFDQRAAAYARYGRTRAGADIQLNMESAFVANTLWFDPNPGARGTPQAVAVPVDKVDAYSAILHEMGHAFFLNGLRNSVSYQPTDAKNPNDRSTFDTGITFVNGDPFYTGANAQAAYGNKPVPLTRGNLYHLGNASGAGSDLESLLMNGNTFDGGQRYFIGDLERAIAADVVAAGTRPVVDPQPTNDPTPTVFTILRNATFTYTSSNNVLVTIIQRGNRSSTVITFPPGTSTTQPVGDPTSVQVTSSDTASTLAFAAASDVQIGKLSVPGGRGIKSIIAPNVTITDTSDITGAMQLTLGQIKQTSLTVGNILKNGVFSLGVVTGSDLKLPVSRSVTLARFTPTDVNSQKLALGGSQSLTVTGELAGRVEVSSGGSLKSVSLGSVTGGALVMSGTGGTVTVAGGVSGSTLTAGKWGNIVFNGPVENSTVSSTGTTLGDVTAKANVSGSLISARTSTGKLVLQGTLSGSQLLAGGMIKSVSVAGAVTGSTILGQTGVGPVSLVSVVGSRLLAGLSVTGTLPTVFPTALPTFSSSKAAIGNVSIAGAFSSTLIVAPRVGAVTVGNTTTDNGGTKFGVATKGLGLFASLTPAVSVAKGTKATNVSSGDLVVSVQP